MLTKAGTIFFIMQFCQIKINFKQLRKVNMLCSKHEQKLILQCWGKWDRVVGVSILRGCE